MIDNPENLLDGKDYEGSLWNAVPEKKCPKCGGILMVFPKWETCRHCKQYFHSFTIDGDSEDD